MKSSNRIRLTQVGTLFDGCTESSAQNYVSGANRDDGSCVRAVFGCMSRNYDSTATLDSNCVYNIFGCTDSEKSQFPHASEQFVVEFLLTIVLKRLGFNVLLRPFTNHFS